jgi:hypothetical protein
MIYSRVVSISLLTFGLLSYGPLAWSNGGAGPDQDAGVSELPGEVNSVPRSMDAQTTKGLPASTKEAISADMNQLRASLVNAKSLTKDLTSAQSTLEKNRISRQINLVAREVSMERQYLEDKAKNYSALQSSTDYQNLLGDVSSFEMSAKELPSTAKNVDQEISLSLNDVKNLS